MDRQEWHDSPYRLWLYVFGAIATGILPWIAVDYMISNTERGGVFYECKQIGN